MRGEARIVHDVRSLIVPLAKIAAATAPGAAIRLLPRPLRERAGVRGGPTRRGLSYPLAPLGERVRVRG